MSLTLASCSKNDVYDLIKKRIINFSMSTNATRTAYGATPGQKENPEAWKIYWQSDDKVRVYSAECPELHQADYLVNPDGTNAQNGKMSPVDDDAQLYWTDDKTLQHTFTAAYPASTDVEYAGVGQFRFKVPTEQSNASDYMKYAYMIACKSGVTSTLDKDAVLLSFKPIMTTFEVTLQGTTANRTIESVDFTTKMPCDDEMKFIYSATTSSAPTPLKTETIVWTPTDDTKLIAGKGEGDPNTLTFNIFLPFTTISDENNLVITIHARDEHNVEKTFVATLNPDTKILGGEKKLLKLPKLEEKIYPVGISGIHEGFLTTVDFLDF